MDTNNNINNENENNNEVTKEELHNVSDNHKHNNKKSKLSSKHKKILIISIVVLCLLVIGLVAVILFTGKDKNTSKKHKKIIVESNMTEKEYKAIVDAYGDAVALASNNYMTLKNGEIPSFKDIKDSIVFDKHKVVCKTNKINFDGSVYLNSCTVDGNEITKNYSNCFD